MRILAFLLVAMVAFGGFSGEAFAKKKTGWSFWSLNWGVYKFEPYIGEQQIRQRSLWDGDHWTPEAWIEDAGDEKRIMRDLYASGIIVKQYTGKKNIPVLKVGEPFTRLSGIDQRRVLEFVDHVFEITTAEENGMFYVVYENDKKEPMGLYNQYGFQSY